MKSLILSFSLMLFLNTSLHSASFKGELNKLIIKIQQLINQEIKESIAATKDNRQHLSRTYFLIIFQQPNNSFYFISK
ncbi:MAG: hypothetical protein Q9M92_06105 [Enterobacterales bacterium]|nr:hypothetical protein [Enterobacterales bacterium]